MPKENEHFLKFLGKIAAHRSGDDRRTVIGDFDTMYFRYQHQALIDSTKSQAFLILPRLLKFPLEVRPLSKQKVAQVIFREGIGFKKGTAFESGDFLGLQQKKSKLQKLNAKPTVQSFVSSSSDLGSH